jgi:hypothetical protein
MKLKHLIFLGLLFILLIALSCNKDKRQSKRLMRGESWRVSELKVDGQSEDMVEKMVFSTCDIYDEFCTALWISTEEDTASFYWQMNERGTEFKLLRFNDADSCCSNVTAADYYCFQLSGTYQVIQAKRNSMEFESTTTVGYSGQKVRMVLDRLQ